MDEKEQIGAAIKLLIASGLAVTNASLDIWIVKDGDRYEVDSMGDAVDARVSDADEAIDLFLDSVADAS